MDEALAGRDGDEDEGDEFWAALLHGWTQAGLPGGEGPDAHAGRAADDLRERLRRSGGRLPGSDPRR